MRMNLVQRFKKLIASFNMDASIRPVGSYVTGLYLPTSDIDMVVTFQPGGYSSRLYLYTLIEKIRDSGFASKVDNVLNASIPLIRITDKITGIQIDLTAADTHAVKATEAVQKWLELSPPARPLLFVVKMLLSIRRCGTTYTGGINSYVLFWMIVAWVELEMPKKRPMANVDDDLSSFITTFEELRMLKEENVATSSSSWEGLDLGKLLIKFLGFYARFDCETNAIKIEPRPAYCTKTYPYSRYTVPRYLLSIYDPANTFIDMGSKAYGIKHIQASFDSAYWSLVNLEGKWKLGLPVGEAGILGSVLGGDYTKFLEKRRLAVAQFSNMRGDIY